MSNLRGWTLTLSASVTLETETCCSCGVLFAMGSDLHCQRRRDGKLFYCPNGHEQHYTAEKNAQEKLAAAEAAATAARDQLGAAVREAEKVRVNLLRDRHRVANGVCPCCNRYFPQVHQHMRTQHPEFDVSKVSHEPAYGCSCGRTFDTLRGLRTHQGHVRPADWEQRSRSDSQWRRETAHTTKVDA
jgi:hypothetical protein